MAKNQDSNGSFNPPKELYTVSVGKYVNLITKEVFYNEASIFDPKALVALGLLHEVEPQKSSAKFSEISSNSSTDTASALGISVEAEAQYNLTKVAGKYDFNLAKAKTTSSERLNVYMSYFFTDAHQRLDYGPARNTDIINALTDDVKIDYFSVINATNPVERFQKYKDFTSKYGTGCVTKVILASGSIGEVNMQFSSAASQTKMKQNAALSIKYQKSADFAAAISSLKEESEKHSNLTFGFETSNFPATSTTEDWLADMVKDVFSKIKDKDFKIDYPDTPVVKPEFKKIEPFTEKELNIRFTADAQTLLYKAKTSIEQKNFFGALALLLEAQKISIQKLPDDKKIRVDIEEELTSTKSEIHSKYGKLKILIYEDDAYKIASTPNLIEVYEFLQELFNQQEVKIPDAQSTLTKALSVYNDRLAFITQKVDEGDVDKDKIEPYINFLIFYKTVAKDKAVEIDALINRLKELTEQELNLFEEDHFEDAAERLRVKMKNMDGYSDLSLQEYDEKLRTEIKDFKTLQILEQVSKIEALALNNQLSFQEVNLPGEAVQKEPLTTTFLDSLNGQFCAIEVETMPWGKIFPDFTFNFKESLTGIFIAKLNIYYRTRLQFLEYLTFYQQMDDITKSIRGIYADCCDYLSSQIKTKIYDVDPLKNGSSYEKEFNEIVTNFIKKFNEDISPYPHWLSIYKTFYKNYKFFRSRRMGYTIKTELKNNQGESNLYFPVLSKLGIHNEKGKRVQTYKLSERTTAEGTNLATDYRCYPCIKFIEGQSKIVLFAYCANEWSSDFAFSKVLDFDRNENDINFYHARISIPIELKEKDFQLEIINKSNENVPGFIAQYLINDEGHFTPLDSSDENYNTINLSLISLNPKNIGEKKVLGSTLFHSADDWIV